MDVVTGAFLIFAFLIFCMMSYVAGRDAEERCRQREAIKRGFAFYHPRTRAFTWKDAKEMK